MSNPSTESEFDKELDKRFYEYLGGTPDDDELEDWREFKSTIKQAVDKHVIGEDESILTDISAVQRSGFDIAQQVTRDKKMRNSVLRRQRKALYGGDRGE